MKTIKYITIAIIIALLITGFLVPPRGSIDASIFAAISLIWGFYKLWEFYIKVENGEDGEFNYNGIFIKFFNRKKKNKVNSKDNEKGNVDDTSKEISNLICILQNKITLPSSVLRESQYTRPTKEEKVQKILFEELKKIYGQSNVNTEFSVGGHWGMKSDVDLFHGKIGIELKVAEQLKSASNVERLIGQVVYYMKKQYGNNFIVLVAGKSKEYDASMQELEEIINSLGAKCIYKEVI